ncbi:hypothetical protein Tco_1104128 [Tanacetum coccineum]
MPTTRQDMGFAEIEKLVTQPVADAFATYEANQNSGNGITKDTSGSARGVEHITLGCSNKEFLNCKPCNFDGTEGAICLTRWFKRMESMFRISNGVENCQVKYATCTLLDGALTWWNSHVQSIRIDDAYKTTWKEVIEMMTKEYCSRNELQKMETEI